MKTSSIEESCFRKRLRARSSRNQLDLSIPFEGRQMTERTLEADYVIVGSGAVAMAFADTLLTDTEASIVMVDRRHKPELLHRQLAAETRCDVPISRKAQVSDLKPRYALLSQM
jgi:siroheme synthase (precorrin-2 oxidase/ferrochelatase)